MLLRQLDAVVEAAGEANRAEDQAHVAADVDDGDEEGWVVHFGDGRSVSRLHWRSEDLRAGSQRSLQAR